MNFSKLSQLSFLFPEMALNWQTFVAFENTLKRVQILWTILGFYKDFTGDLKKASGYLRFCHDTRETNALVCWYHLFKARPPFQDFNIKIWYFKCLLLGSQNYYYSASAELYCKLHLYRTWWITCLLFAGFMILPYLPVGSNTPGRLSRIHSDSHSACGTAVGLALQPHMLPCHMSLHCRKLMKPCCATWSCRSSPSSCRMTLMPQRTDIRRYQLAELAVFLDRCGTLPFPMVKWWQIKANHICVLVGAYSTISFQWAQQLDGFQHPNTLLRVQSLQL